MHSPEIGERAATAAVDAAIRVHSAIGPGPLEHACLVCMAYELRSRGFDVVTQAALPLVYRGVRLEAGYRVDMLVEDSLIIEIKSVEHLLPVHKAQLLTYLRLGGVRLGLLMNFKVERMKDGIDRLINDRYRR